MEVQRSWLYMCCACVIATWRLGLRTPPVSANWKKRTHQKNCLLHHEPFVVWLDGVQEDIEPKWYQPLWCHDPEKNRRNIWFNIGGEFKARWMRKKEKDDFSVSDTGGSEEKIRLPHSIERLHCDVAGWLVLEWLWWLPPRECFVLSSWGSFLERPGNFSGPKANPIVKTGWIAGQFLAHKPVNFASLTDRFILISFSKLLEPWS